MADSIEIRVVYYGFPIYCSSYKTFKSTNTLFLECIQNQLVQKNVFVAVCHAMKTHKSDNFVQEAGCRALRGLCIFRLD